MPDPIDELALLRAALAAAEARATAVEAELSTTRMVLAQHRAVVSTSEAVIAALKLEIALLKREQYGRSAERTARLIDQPLPDLVLILEVVLSSIKDALRWMQPVLQPVGAPLQHPAQNAIAFRRQMFHQTPAAVGSGMCRMCGIC